MFSEDRIMYATMEIIGKRIRQRRLEMHLKQKDLAEMLDVSNNHISNIENGASMASLDLFVRICDALKVTPDYIVLGVMHPNNIPQNICDKINRCNPEDQIIIDELVDSILKNRSKKKKGN